MAGLVHPLRQWMRLSVHDRRLAATAVVGLLTIPLATRLWSLPRLLPRPTPQRDLSDASSRHVAELVARTAAALPWPTSCLTRALTTAHLVARHGGTCTLVLAAQRPSDGFVAHAWIEVAGESTDPQPNSPWHPLARWDIPSSTLV